jgi:hypothetical protein
MSSRCHPFLVVVRELLGPAPSGNAVSLREIELAFLHLRRCPSCRSTLTPEEYTFFVSRVLLEKE